jgi:hypothetical protein
MATKISFQWERELTLSVAALKGKPGKKDDYALVGRLLVPKRIPVLWENDDGSPDLAMLVEVVDGVPTCREVTMRAAAGGREITRADVKALDRQLDNLIGLVVASKSMDIGLDGAVGTLEAAYLEAGRVRRSQPRTMTPTKLREIASLYRQHAASGKPARAIADHYSTPDHAVSIRTARFWVAQARAKGYLDSGTVGRAGEAAKS